MEQPPLSLESPITPRMASSTAVPLTAMQLRVWRDQHDRGSRLTVRKLSMTMRILGRLDLGLLRVSVATVVARHEALRTRFSGSDEPPSQRFDAPLTWEIVDVSRGSPAEIEQRAQVAASECMDERIIISAGPLLSIKILRLADQDHVIVISLEHLISDAVSNAIIQAEIWSAYRLAALGRPLSLPPVSAQFGDYALWQQRTYLAWRQKHASYWIQRLSGAPTTLLPVDGILREEDASESMEFWLGAEISTRLRDLARRERCMISLAVFAIYIIVMSHWCKQNELLVILVSNGRDRPALRNTIGWVATHLYLRVSLESGDSFRDLLQRVNHELVTAMAHHDFDRIPDFVPGCQTDLYFNWVSTPGAPAAQNSEGSVNGALKALPFTVKKCYSPKFTPFLFDSPLGIGVYIDYAAHLYAHHTVQRFVDNLRLAADAVSQSPLAPIGDASGLLR